VLVGAAGAGWLAWTSAAALNESAAIITMASPLSKMLFLESRKRFCWYDILISWESLK
jgi:hypothetical protein